jgi:hypothetical protein
LLASVVFLGICGGTSTTSLGLDLVSFFEEEEFSPFRSSSEIGTGRIRTGVKLKRGPEASISTGKLKRRKWSGAEISAGMFLVNMLIHSLAKEPS